jgi:hypothetical protein
LKRGLLLLVLCSPAFGGTLTVNGGGGGTWTMAGSGTGSMNLNTPAAAGGGGTDTVIFDTATSSLGTSFANPCSWSITIGQGSSAVDKVAVLACNGLGTNHITAADIGGTSFVSKQVTIDPTGNGSVSEIWTAVNPPTGAQTVSVTLNAGNCGGVGGETCTVMDFTGVKQAAPVDVSTGAYADSAQTVTATRSTTIDKDYIVSTGGNGYSGVTIADGSSQTMLNNVHNTVNGYNSAQAYKGPITPAGSTAITWNAVGGIDSVMSMCWIALQPGP